MSLSNTDGRDLNMPINSRSSITTFISYESKGARAVSPSSYQRHPVNIYTTAVHLRCKCQCRRSSVVVNNDAGSTIHFKAGSCKFPAVVEAADVGNVDLSGLVF